MRGCRLRSSSSRTAWFIVVFLVNVVAFTILPAMSAGAQTADSDGSDESIFIVSTVPVVPGVTVTLDGKSKVTDSSGVAFFGTKVHTDPTDRIVVVTPDVSPNETEKAHFTRLYRMASNHYALAFDIERPATFSFVGVNGEEVDVDTIESVDLKNSLGGQEEGIPLDRPVWLYSERVVSESGGPQVRDIEWSVESVTVRGVNLVHRAQTRFLPRERSDIKLELLFFSAHFQITDMFFGSARTGTIELTYPDGEVITHQLDADGELFLPSVPRGEYQVLIDSSGPRIARPVVISRNQEVNLDLLTWLDITIVGVAGSLFLVVPLVIGRRLRRRTKSREAVAVPFEELAAQLAESSESLDSPVIAIERDDFLSLVLEPSR